MDATATLTWNAAVEAAFVPTDLDRKATTGVFGTGAPRVGADDRIAVPSIVRARAAHAYLAAHDGEEAVVQYVDPASADDRSRLVYRQTGTLTADGFVRYPVFGDRAVTSEYGLLVDGYVIPLNGLVSIEAEGDRATVTL